jgi:hypothetical protein
MDREQVLALLRRNDPREKHVKIWMLHFSDDVLCLSEALQANDHVNSIYLDFSYCDVRNTNWDSLLRDIAERVNLVDVILRDYFLEPGRNPPDRLIPFVRAIQLNGRVQTVSFESIQLSSDLMDPFLDSTTSIRKLKLSGCDMEAPEDALAIAAAPQRNTNIQQLFLARVNGRIVIPVLNSPSSSR